MNSIDRYGNVIRPTTPRLWVDYNKGDSDSTGVMSWGVGGLIPHPLIISQLIRVQVALCDGSNKFLTFEPCPEPKLVIAWPSLDKGLELIVPTQIHGAVWFLDRSMPMDQLLTMLEVAKSTITAGMLMQQQQSRQQQAAQRVRQYGTDGRPINN